MIETMSLAGFPGQNADPGNNLADHFSLPECINWFLGNQGLQISMGSADRPLWPTGKGNEQDRQ
ncbi:hypothetical protein NKG95_18530 [Mesorhizobium sp. M1423]|uniref:hypothetical protein n=1 Tax=Mesorhizobium sp. M1423 TaxID=2957101 RepID=UPI00333BB217